MDGASLGLGFSTMPVTRSVAPSSGVDATIALRGFAWGTQTAEVANTYLTTGSTGEDYFIQAPTLLVDSESIEGKSNEDLR